MGVGGQGFEVIRDGLEVGDLTQHGDLLVLDRAKTPVILERFIKRNVDKCVLGRVTYVFKGTKCVCESVCV